MAFSVFASIKTNTENTSCYRPVVLNLGYAKTPYISSPTSGGRSVGIIVRSSTKVTELLVILDIPYRLHNLNYTPTTLWLQSLREIKSGRKRKKKVEYHRLAALLRFTSTLKAATKQRQRSRHCTQCNTEM
jgi:hypothetical protein